jgi:endonuclease/exonuclease/phosphatase family metal-dependent hydrolase
MIEPPDAMSQSNGEPATGHGLAAGVLGRVGPRSRWDLLGVVPLALVVFALVSVVTPLGLGPLGLLLVLEEQAFVVVLVLLAPVALLARARTLASALLVAAVVGGCLFGSEWISLPGSAGGAGAGDGAGGRNELSAMTWNLQYGTRSAVDTVAQLQNVSTDIVALEELEPGPSAAIEADPTLSTRYPYRLMSPRKGAWGIGVLSRYPIAETDSSYPPACLEMLVITPAGPVRLIVGHPNHADIGVVSPLRIPVQYDSADRDEEIAAIRVRIDRSLAAGERLLVLGDYNTTPTEPEFKVLTRDLKDTHTEVGEGPGWTWRPSRFTFLPFGFLRIDLQLTAGPIRPASTSMDCSLPGDHCRLFGTYAID